MDKFISVIIPAFGNQELLNSNMRILLKELQNSNAIFEIIVVDDCSPNRISINLPLTKVHRLKTNKGFSVSCNEGAFVSKYPFLLFLNSDITVTNGFLDSLFKHFDDKSVFSVTPKIIKNNFIESITTGRLRGSNLICEEVKNASIDHAIEIFYACGAASLIKKEIFFTLGGFDELFSPFYVEDMDLSYRAWKSGYRVIYEPNSTVYHLSGKTISQNYHRFYVESIWCRNRYIFRWKNFTDPAIVFFMIVELFTLKLLKNTLVEWAGLFRAIPLLREILKARKKNKFILRDKQIFAKFRNLNEKLQR